MELERRDNRVGLGIGVGGRGLLHQAARDRRDRGLVERERLLDPEHVERRDVSAVRRVFDRRPHLGRGPGPQFRARARDQVTPARPQRSQGVEQRGVVVDRAVETTRIADLVLHRFSVTPTGTE